MSECICVKCTHKCSEYFNNVTSDKAYYEWARKEERCLVEDGTEVDRC